MNYVFRIGILVGLLFAATAASAQRIGTALPPFSGAVTRITTRRPNTVPASFRGPVALLKEELRPDFDIYTKDSVGFDHGRTSPVVVVGYNNLRSDVHPWAVEAGYKYVDTSDGHSDLYLLSAWLTAWSRSSSDGSGSDSLTLEADGAEVNSQRRLDTYGIFEVSRTAAKLDVFAGVSTVRGSGDRNSAFTFAVSPTLPLSPKYSINGLYAFENKIDGEDYAEISVARTFEKPEIQIAFVAAKHGTYAIRFQKTLKHVFRRPM